MSMKWSLQCVSSTLTFQHQAPPGSFSTPSSNWFWMELEGDYSDQPCSDEWPQSWNSVLRNLGPRQQPTEQDSNQQLRLTWHLHGGGAGIHLDSGTQQSSGSQCREQWHSSVLWALLQGRKWAHWLLYELWNTVIIRVQWAHRGSRPTQLHLQHKWKLPPGKELPCLNMMAVHGEQC